VAAPFAAATATPTRAATANSATLPFTGLNILWQLLGGLILLVTGVTLRRLGPRRH
jgi:hypothetical protein